MKLGAHSIYYSGPAPNHPSGTVGVPAKGSESLVTTRNVTWLDLRDARCGSWGRATPTQEKGGSIAGNTVDIFSAEYVLNDTDVELEEMSPDSIGTILSVLGPHRCVST